MSEFVLHGIYVFQHVAVPVPHTSSHPLHTPSHFHSSFPPLTSSHTFFPFSHYFPFSSPRMFTFTLFDPCQAAMDRLAAAYEQEVAQAKAQATAKPQAFKDMLGAFAKEREKDERDREGERGP
jgi:hypothetical protein